MSVCMCEGCMGGNGGGRSTWFEVFRLGLGLSHEILVHIYMIFALCCGVLRCFALHYAVRCY